MYTGIGEKEKESQKKAEFPTVQENSDMEIGKKWFFVRRQ